MNGLIKRGYLSGNAFSISNNNYDDNRHTYPIQPNITGDWCSKSLDKHASAYWGLNFSKYVYLTNYSLQNTDRAFIKSFYVQGKLRNGQWKTISIVKDSTAGSLDVQTFPVTNRGPFSAINFTSTENGYYDSQQLYYFCIYKVEFFGAVLSVPFFPSLNHSRLKSDEIFIYLILIFPY